ncbi:MAG: polysaccharide pyruvyl transferase family protein [Propionibacteriaceae bacterium]|nr:polysaccharide pyruvyl transferase family protein [Propionibacteriaceae bacterium]
MVTYYALHDVLSTIGFSTAMIPSGSRQEPVQPLPNTYPIRFAREHYAVVERRTKQAMGELNNEFQAFLCGSDQLWNPTIDIVDDENFLSFADDGKLLVSYATSFGGNAMDARWKKPVIQRNIKNLQRFDSVSVREDYGAKIARDVFGVTATSVLDPVFLAGRPAFDKLISAPPITDPGDTLFAFILDPTVEKRDTVERISRQLGLGRIAVMTGADPRTFHVLRDIFDTHQVLDVIGMDLFLGLISQSAYIVTDSFHGTCLSWIYQRPFSSFFNEKRGSDRFVYLMDLLGMESRRVEVGASTQSLAENGNVSFDLDFSASRERVALEATRSLFWLQQALKPLGAPHVQPPAERKNSEIHEAGDVRSIFDVAPVHTRVRLVSDWSSWIDEKGIGLKVTRHDHEGAQHWEFPLDQPLLQGFEYEVVIDYTVEEGAVEAAWSLQASHTTNKPLVITAEPTTTEDAAPISTRIQIRDAGVDTLVLNVRLTTSGSAIIIVRRLSIEQVAL